MNFNCGVRTATDCKLLRLTPCKKELLSDKNFSLYFYLKTSDRVYEMYKLAMLRMLFPSNEVLAYWLLKLAKDGTNLKKQKVSQERISASGSFSIVLRIFAMKG